jgi:chromate reductase
MVRITAFAGSTRGGSFNRKLVKIAAAGAKNAGAEVELLELKDYSMPLMDEDLEAEKGMPERAAEFKAKLEQSDGFIISAPEYNSSITPLLKNALDWASRSRSPEEKPLSAFRGRTAVLMSASPGSLGGMRGLVPLRMLLGELGVTVIPPYKCISGAYDAFTEDGSLKDEKLQKAVMNLGKQLVEAIEGKRHGNR